MKNPIRLCLRCIAEWLVRVQRYRYLRAHLWDDAVHAMDAEGCA